MLWKLNGRIRIIDTTMLKWKLDRKPFFCFLRCIIPRSGSYMGHIEHCAGGTTTCLGRWCKKYEKMTSSEEGGTCERTIWFMIIWRVGGVVLLKNHTHIYNVLLRKNHLFCFKKWIFLDNVCTYNRCRSYPLSTNFTTLSFSCKLCQHKMTRDKCRRYKPVTVHINIDPPNAKMFTNCKIVSKKKLDILGQ